MRVPAAWTRAVQRPAGEPTALAGPTAQRANSQDVGKVPGGIHNTRMSRCTRRGPRAHRRTPDGSADW